MKYHIITATIVGLIAVKFYSSLVAFPIAVLLIMILFFLLGKMGFGPDYYKFKKYQ